MHKEIGEEMQDTRNLNHNVVLDIVYREDKNCDENVIYGEKLQIQRILSVLY